MDSLGKAGLLSIPKTSQSIQGDVYLSTASVQYHSCVNMLTLSNSTGLIFCTVAKYLVPFEM